MKLTILNALLVMLVGLVLVITGAFMKLRESPFSNSTVFSGLAVDFLGAIFLVLGLHRRRRKG